MPLPSLPEQLRQAAPSPGSPQSLLWRSEEMRHGGGSGKSRSKWGVQDELPPLLAFQSS